MLKDYYMRITQELLDENRLYLFDKTDYEDLERTFFISRFKKDPSSNNIETKGTLKLTYIFNEDGYNTKKIIKIFEEFLSMFNNIVFEKGREFIVEHTDGGSYDLDRAKKDENNLNEYLIKYVNELLDNFDKKADNKIIITLFISGIGKQFVIKSEVTINKTSYPDYSDEEDKG